jgi:phosphatidylserine/phosphatidylglycerophosphate/cardiolipin synthase-like enzyme
MTKITKARVWSNGEVAYLAWEAGGLIQDCLGFMITRVHESGPDAGMRRILPTWIAFTDQSNPDWLEQDSSVWPIQSYEWRDLTLRRSRDTTAVRPIDFRVHYEIAPVGLQGIGPVPASQTAPFLDAAGKPRYLGPQHPLFLMDAPFETDPIDVTHDFLTGKDKVRATYTNGILSTQNLLRQLESLNAGAAADVPAGPLASVATAATSSSQDDSDDDGDAAIPKGVLDTLKDHIGEENDPLRLFLTADVLDFLLSLVSKAEQGQGELYLALYELHDPELIRRLVALTAAGKAHVILSTSGTTDLNRKNDPPPKAATVWDTGNFAARQKLHQANATAVQDRLFNNDDHIGHNKFAVYVEGGIARSVMTGSTNWTETGLCTQSNNVVIIENEEVAGRYLDFWHRLSDDVQPAGVPLTVSKHGRTATGFERNKGFQGPVLRRTNATPASPIVLADGRTTIETYFSPNTKAKVKNEASPTPVDLSRVYALMEHADKAILFLTFYPGVRGEQNIIGQAADLAKTRPELLIQGAISNPAALPPAMPGEPTTYQTVTGETKDLPQRAIWWPDGENSRLVMVRAAAVSVKTGDLRPELLSAGHAIIHDKIIVIDPLDPINCTVITGSHNLGYKASYQNDENLLIIRGNQRLAMAYATHVLDVYDHYVTRARLQENYRNALIKTGRPPQATSGGFLKKTDEWQKKWFNSDIPTSRDYFLS